MCIAYRYLAHGTATDYMYDVARVPVAFTFEVCECLIVNWGLVCASFGT